MSEKPKTVIEDSDTRVTITTGTFVTIVRGRMSSVRSRRAYQEIGSLQQEVLRLREQIETLTAEADEEVARLEEEVLDLTIGVEE